MLARLATGRIDRPSGPPVSDAQFNAPIRTTSAAASVDRMKNGPLSRAQITASTAPAAAQTSAPIHSPIHGVTPPRTNRIVEV